MLTKEEYEGLPEKARGAFTQEGDLFVPAKDAKLKQTLNELDSKYKEASNKLSEYEQSQAQRQAEAERKALEKLKAEGKTDEIIADIERRNGETVKQFQERIERMANQIKTEKRSALVSDLAAELATDKGSRAFKALVQSRIDVDAETGKVTFLNDDGSASSLDLSGFKAELMKDDSLSPLLKADLVTQGGGNVKGSNGDGRTSFAQGNMGGSRTEREAAIAKRFKLKQ
jgi:DNA-binding CsgD family transcriptional regulator